MAGRTRNQLYHTFQGTGGNTDDSVQLGGVSVVNGKSVCNDVTGAGDNNSFDVRHMSFEGGRLDKARSQFGNHFESLIADRLLFEGTWQHAPRSGLLSNITYATQLAARTNPSRPYVDVPVNILELGDIVRLIKNRGRGIIFDHTSRDGPIRRHGRNVARTNLLYQFGIAPLVGDIVKTTEFQRVFNKRKEEIGRLAGPKGLRRTVDLDSSSADAVDTNFSFHSNLATVRGRLAVTTTENVRGHIRWGATPDFSRLHQGDLDNPAMERAIRNALYGITNNIGDLSTLWEAIPWSWLIDWGTTVGDYLKAQRNIIPASVRDIRIMRHVRSEWVWHRTQFGTNPPGFMSGGTRYLIDKSRSPSTPVAPTAHFPFLSGKQVGILSSLAVTRMR
jgi:hypothetical protein